VSATFAFLHHIAAFTLVSALAVELAFTRSELTLANARALLVTDAIYGLSAATVLTAGLLRVFYFEKGSYYYFHSVPFIAKLSLFIIVGLLSIYPTLQFRSWRAALKRGAIPVVDPATVRSIRAVIHWEMVGLVALVLCAALMARGIGYVGR